MNNIKVPRVLLGFSFIATRLWLIVSALFILAIASVIISVFQKDLAWLSAFGGIMTIFGVLLTVSHSVPKTDEEIQRFVETRFPESRDGMMANFEEQSQKLEVDTMRKIEADRVLKSEAYGLLITIFGTLIWAYSGFLNSLFWP
jgi:membrane-bound ClpP family serine protease